MKRFLYIFISAALLASCSAKKDVYMFTSFHEPATDGLRMLYSFDAYHWTDLNKILIKPEVGDKVMRDPSIAQGKDGVFHLVWTSAWTGGKGFGYADSKDLLHWSPQRLINVMEDEPTVVNVWAPEIFYDDDNDQFIIVWASTIPGRFPVGTETENNNHRLYYTVTRDFKTFAKEKLFYDPGFSAIDAEIIKRAKNDYVMVVKDNTRPNRNIKVAFANNPLGPYTKASGAFTDNFTEGPTVAKAGDNYLIYYDAYREKIFGAQSTTDFKTFTNITKQVDVPVAHKHGTIFKTTKKVLSRLKQ
ncbi:glycoside hydrolase family 43 protein [Mucilaginibacter sp. HMF5004]|uniref:glycoside hydrolase family 43 protein n=1 Tax=Mucilaginibacter rivuli TaxID=2857527 RepID=UPI001C607905|nr:glycoside hydrolase family 43 protein [Mucilaginibacter rivuli]MBW4889024.1 glycoside hydrolase family 43 protein [Mucilaginibacter rivuli]